MRTPSLSLLAAVSLLSLFGCTLDHAKVEDAIREHAAKYQVTLKTVSCPSGRSRRAGETFDCRATDDEGHDVVYTVNVEADTYRFNTQSFDVDEAVVGHGLEKLVGGNVTINCPAKHVLMKPGQVITCPVAGAKQRSLLITMVTQKTFRWEGVN